MTEHETNLRDLAAMFAMCALVMRDESPSFIMSGAFQLADRFMEKRKQIDEAAVEDGGIASLKTRKKKAE